MSTTPSASNQQARPLEWVKPPQQQRSQKTLARLLDAAEGLIVESGLDAVTVSAVTKRAGSSVGSFYARFADKEALIRCVLERFTDQALATASAVLEPTRWEGVPVHDALVAMMRFMLQVVDERQGVVLALLVRSARDPELTALGQRLNDQIAVHLHGLIAQCGHAVDHDDAETAIRMAVWMILSAMQTRALDKAGQAGAFELDDDSIAQQMALMIIRYVGIEGAEQAMENVPASGARRAAGD
jgi:AcrR family transcriptional regulator